ncbi:MAG: ComEA family DNA-binding protein [Lachnospiraceae bacterium]
MQRKYRWWLVIVAVCLLTGGCTRTPTEDKTSEVIFTAEEALTETPVQTETPAQTPEAQVTPVYEVNCVCQCTAQAAQTEIAQPDPRLDINQADAAALQTIRGIGAIRAEAIIAYRNANGPFQTIEEIKNGDGIKNGIFEKIKEQIRIG